MAQKIQTLFIDDLDGSEADGTVRFGLDGTDYEIDLNTEHAQRAAGRTGTLRKCRPPSRRRRPAPSPQRT